VKTAAALILTLLMAVAPAWTQAPAPAPSCADSAPACCDNCAQCCSKSSLPQRGEQAPIPARSLSAQQIQLLFVASVVFIPEPAREVFVAVPSGSALLQAASVPLFTRHCSYLV